MKRIDLNRGWQFCKLPGCSIDDLSVVNADGTTELVNLPHTWYDDNALEPYRGLTLYRKQITIASEWRSKVLYLEIPGADNHAKIILNGTPAGEHKGGYSRFCVPVPANMLNGEVLDVQIYLSNAVCEDISPLAGDFTVFGGLYRGVSLLVEESEHFDVCYYGTDGVVVRTAVEQDGCGKVYLNSHVVAEKTSEVQYTLVSPNGIPVVRQTTQSGTSCTLTVERPELWDGKVHPALYSLTAKLVCNGVVTDVVTKKVGFRSIRMDAEQGFFLNGKHYRIQGVAKHQDFAGCFNAVTGQEIDRDFALIREIGANAIRLSHYQHPQGTYDRCDQEGYVVWAEVPMLKMTRNPALIENICLQLTELVLQNQHHPSICFWGIQNEIGMFRDTPDVYENLAEMRTLVNTLDPERLVTAANMYTVKFKSGLNHGTDMIGYNIYFGWYYGQMQEYDGFLDRYHAANPEMPLGISEYGVDANPGLHSAEPRVQDYTEEYQALFHETVYPIFESKSYLWGSFVWNMFDFSSALRKDGGLRNLNAKGLVTYDRQIRKDAFYYYKAKWSEEPFVHLCGKRFAKRTEEAIEVKIYTNQSEATLSVNGCILKTLPSDGNGTVRFEEVPLRKGENHICVTAGGCSDEMILTRQDSPEPSYCLPDSSVGGPVKNWFLNSDSLVREGYCSLECTAGELLNNPEAAALLKEKLPQPLYHVLTEQDVIPLGIKMKNILNREKLPEEALKALNDALNKIPAEE